MHIYQKRILDMLRQQPTMRYTELQPDGVESSHFAYHLQQLIKQGDVAHVSRGTYSLTSQGQAAVDKLSKGSVNPKAGPKVITYTLLKDNAYYYLQRKDKEPYLGLLNMIGGKVHLGEFTAQASVREVYEKTGLNISTTTLHGTAEISIMQHAHLISHVIAYIYSANITGMDIPNSLLKVPETEVTAQVDVAPDLLPLLNVIQKNTAPFAIQLSLSIL